MDDIFPPLTRANVLACQCSSWYKTLQTISIKTTIIKPLPSEFRTWLESDSIVLPEGSEDTAQGNTFDSDGEEEKFDDDDDDDGSQADAKEVFRFDELNTQIREAMSSSAGAVFPKLNWTSPQDASWILNPSSPLKCTSPSDIYLYLKSSDFIGHDIDPEMVFDGCIGNVSSTEVEYELELVLKKWYGIEKSREMRCFVRDDVLIGISQRDSNYYEFLNDEQTRDTIRTGIQTFWETKIKGKFQGSASYIFDVLLTRSLSSANLVDINPFAPRTSALLFTYTELHNIFLHPESLPVLRVIPSADHPAAIRNAPSHQHNMIPREALELSQGRGIDEFRETWIDQIRKAMDDDS